MMFGGASCIFCDLYEPHTYFENGFVGPSHRLQAQISATARVLDIELSCMYLPDVMLISLEDGSTGTSNIKFIRQSSALDMGKLYDAFRLYRKVRDFPVVDYSPTGVFHISFHR